MVVVMPVVTCGAGGNMPWLWRAQFVMVGMCCGDTSERGGVMDVVPVLLIARW